MKVYTKTWTLKLPISLDEAWHFFSRPENLEQITPRYMQFKIHSDIGGKEMYPGMMINYTVKPILGIAMHWTTEITHIRDGQYFVDEQRSGPYSIWHHEHHFKAVSGGVEMEDILNYSMPLGIFGRLANHVFIDNKIESIFAYRSNVLKSRFV